MGDARRDLGAALPRLILTERAVAGIERCRVFLAERNAAASIKASREIARSFGVVVKSLFIGRPVRGGDDLRELVIRFGGTGYVALYRYDEADDAVIVLAFRHQREAGY